jgi:hypothetical protein
VAREEVAEVLHLITLGTRLARGISASALAVLRDGHGEMNRINAHFRRSVRWRTAHSAA